MKPFVVALAALLAVASAAPQYSVHDPAPKCKTIYDVEYVEEYENKCHTEYKRECETKYKKECHDYEDEVCHPYQRRQCDTKQKEECRTAYKTTYETYTEQGECKKDWVWACEKVWVTDGYGGKKFQEADPKTHPDKCKKLYKTDPKTCHSVQKRRPVKTPYRDCQYVPYKDCYNVDDERCEYVTKQECKRVPYQDCHRAPYQECERIHKEVPTQVARKVCEGDKDWNIHVKASAPSTASHTGSSSGNRGSGFTWN